MVDFITYKKLYDDAKTCGSQEKYVMECGWQDWMDGLTSECISSVLKKIYHMSNGGINEIVSVSGKKFKDFGRVFMIPYSTVLRWKNGNSEAPEYTLLLLGYAAINQTRYDEMPEQKTKKIRKGC